jgi:hypothetical protein
LSTWTRLSIHEAEPPSNAAYVRVYAQVHSSRSDSYVWFDDITITPPWITYLPLVVRQGGTAQAPCGASCQINVDPTLPSTDDTIRATSSHERPAACVPEHQSRQVASRETRINYVQDDSGP